jgi:hypothetical protein
VLVCALAVLGVKEDEWMGLDQYPPILSGMIKVSRFIVVQQALELKKAEDPDSSEFVGCFSWVQRIIDQFMVRGSHSPMQWMLDGLLGLLGLVGLGYNVNFWARKPDGPLNHIG